jgi:hypothetical protein
MSSWNGLVYNNGLVSNFKDDYLEIDHLNIGTPVELEVNDYAAPSPPRSFIILKPGTSTAPSHTQCRSIGTSGVDDGAILVLSGSALGAILMVHSVGNLNLNTASFSLSDKNTMVLIRSASQYYELGRSNNS